MQRPRGLRSRSNGRPEKRRGLEILRDMQQAGVALDPTERLVLELPPGKGSPPYGDEDPDQRGTSATIVVPLVFCENRNLDVMREALVKGLGYDVTSPYADFVRRLADADRVCPDYWQVFRVFGAQLQRFVLHQPGRRRQHAAKDFG